MAKWLNIFKRDKRGQNNKDNPPENSQSRLELHDYPPSVDSHRVAFRGLAEEWGVSIVRSAVKAEGKVDKERLQKLSDRKEMVKEKIFKYVDDMLIFSVQYMIKMCKEGNDEWNGLPIREEYAHKQEDNKYGETHKMVLLLALNKVAEKGYETVEKERNLGTAKLLDYYLRQLDGLLGDEHTIKYETPLFMKDMLLTYVGPVLTEAKRLGVEMDRPSQIMSWYGKNFLDEYLDLFKEYINKVCDDETYSTLDDKLFRKLMGRLISFGGES